MVAFALIPMGQYLIGALLTAITTASHVGYLHEFYTSGWQRSEWSLMVKITKLATYSQSD